MRPVRGNRAVERKCLRGSDYLTEICEVHPRPLEWWLSPRWGRHPTRASRTSNNRNQSTNRPSLPFRRWPSQPKAPLITIEVTPLSGGYYAACLNDRILTKQTRTIPHRRAGPPPGRHRSGHTNPDKTQGQRHHITPLYGGRSCQAHSSRDRDRRPDVRPVCPAITQGGRSGSRQSAPPSRPRGALTA
jgi:hypothetical protein